MAWVKNFTDVVTRVVPQPLQAVLEKRMAQEPISKYYLSNNVDKVEHFAEEKFEGVK